MTIESEGSISQFMARSVIIVSMLEHIIASTIIILGSSFSSGMHGMPNLSNGGVILRGDNLLLRFDICSGYIGILDGAVDLKLQGVLKNI